MENPLVVGLEVYDTKLGFGKVTRLLKTKVVVEINEETYDFSLDGVLFGEETKTLFWSNYPPEFIAV